METQRTERRSARTFGEPFPDPQKKTVGWVSLTFVPGIPNPWRRSESLMILNCRMFLGLAAGKRVG